MTHKFDESAAAAFGCAFGQRGHGVPPNADAALSSDLPHASQRRVAKKIWHRAFVI